MDNLGFASFFNHLLNTKRSTDVTFILQTTDGEVEISAHQLVLAMRSTYFADTFYGEHEEKQNKIIRLENVNPKAFEDMIRYCYDVKPTLDTLEEISVMYGVACEFKLTNLMNLCCKYLGNVKIEPKNVLNVLEVSKYIEEKKVSYICTELIQRKTKQVIESYEINKISPAMVHIILHLPELSLYTEYDLIKWVFEWAKINSKEDDSAHMSVREFLEKVLKYLNFLALTSEELAILCKEYPEFLNSDEIASFALNIVSPGSRELPVWYDKDWKFHECIGKKIEDEIEEARKYIADSLIVVKEFEETLEYIRVSKLHITDFIETRVLWLLIFKEYPIFTDKEKVERLIEILLKNTVMPWKFTGKNSSQIKFSFTETFGTEIRIIKETAKEILEETQRRLHRIHSSFRDYLGATPVRERMPKKLTHELETRDDQYRKVISTLSDIIKNLNVEIEQCEKRLRLLTE